MESQDVLAFVCMRKHPELLEETANLLNAEWPLSLTARSEINNIVICLSTKQVGKLGLGKVFNIRLITMRTFFRHEKDFFFTYYYAKKGRVFRKVLHVNYIRIFGLKFYSRSPF